MKRDNDDIEFDFFDDEPETREAQSTQRVRMPKRGGGGPRKPIHAPHGLTPVLRLMGVIAFAILVVVLLVFWVQSCQGASKRNAYRHYMENVHAIAAASDGIGRDLNELLTTTGQKVSDIEPKLRGYAQREEQDVAKVRSLTPPGPLREEHRSLIEALQFRVSGLQGLADTFRQTATSKDTTSDAKLLADQAQRLVTSGRRLGRPVQGPGDGRAPEAGRDGRRRSRLDLRAQPRPRHAQLDGAPAPAHPWRLDRGHADRRPRHQHRLGQGAPG